jgi:hypothetical protein
MPVLGIIASQNYPRVTNSYESIATVTVGSGGSSSVTFSSIPSTYQHLQIRAFPINATTTGDVYLQFNSDTGANYRSHYLYANGASVASGDTTSNYLYAAFTHSTGGVGITDVLDYGNTNKFKTIRSLIADERNGSGEIALTSGLWRNTSAITSINFFPVSGSFAQYSSFALYGIK